MARTALVGYIIIKQVRKSKCQSSPKPYQAQRRPQSKVRFGQKSSRRTHVHLQHLSVVDGAQRCMRLVEAQGAVATDTQAAAGSAQFSKFS